MEDRQTAAVAALAAGKPIEEAAKASGRSPRTILKWLEEPEFQTAMTRGIRAQALLALSEYLHSGENPTVGQAALAALKWLGAGKPKTRGSKAEAVVEEETDIGEFSEDQLRRVEGAG